uniref:DHHA1 domain-containing protein n=1 Tax=Flavobacterium sp. TaxID=239 RepID=UPI0037C0ADD3
RKYDQDLENILKTTQRLAEIGGYMVPLVNCNYLYASDIGNILAKDQPFSVTYYDTAKSRCFSLRSVPGGVDVSEVANKFNGGGHKHAAGFKVERGHPLACI